MTRGLGVYGLGVYGLGVYGLGVYGLGVYGRVVFGEGKWEIFTTGVGAALLAGIGATTFFPVMII
jgi:hypothetical protein